MYNSQILSLINIAKESANKNFCCNHCAFTVGSALVTSDNKVYTGINVQNDGIQSICAERVAFVKALSEYQNSFQCIVVVGKPVGNESFVKTLPCGYCRQFISEYAHPDFMIYTYDDNDNKIYAYKLKDLLPESFELKKETK